MTLDTTGVILHIEQIRKLMGDAEATDSASPFCKICETGGGIMAEKEIFMMFLESEEDADEKEIKRAYRKLAKKCRSGYKSR